MCFQQVISGYSIDGPARAILDSGTLVFIQKPFMLDKLSEKPMRI